MENALAFIQLSVGCPALLAAVEMWKRNPLSHELASQEFPNSHDVGCPLLAKCK